MVACHVPLQPAHLPRYARGHICLDYPLLQGMEVFGGSHSKHAPRSCLTYHISEHIRSRVCVPAARHRSRNCKGGRGDAHAQGLDFTGSITTPHGGKASMHATRWCLPCHNSAQGGRLHLPTRRQAQQLRRQAHLRTWATSEASRPKVWPLASITYQGLCTAAASAILG